MIDTLNPAWYAQALPLVARPVNLAGRRATVSREFTVLHQTGRAKVRRLLQTDFASVPRLFWCILPIIGWWTDGAIVHDQDYQDGLVSRLAADLRLLTILCDTRDRVRGLEGLLTVDPANPVRWRQMVNHWLNLAVPWIIFAGVRCGGWVAWRGHRRREEKEREQQQDTGHA